MATATLPPSLDLKLRGLAVRVRRGRLLRGSAVVALTALVGFGVAIAFDAAFALPPAGRFALVGAWAGAVAIASWIALARPSLRGVDPFRLAAEVEREYPRLGERLLTTVDLARSPGGFHGSSAFIDELARETDQAAQPMDFNRADPQRANRWLWLAGVVALAALVAPAAVWTDEYLGLSRRFLMPWDRRPAVMPFAMTVSPGTTAAAKGRPLTFRVELTATREGVELPTFATLILNPESPTPSRRRMDAADGNAAAFAWRLDELGGDTTYRVEAGAVSSETMTLTAVAPVELAGPPRIIISSPSYAKSVEPQTLTTPGDATVLQFSKVRFELPLSRPATAAELTWDAGGGGSTETMELLDGGRLAVIDIVCQRSGKLTFRLLAEHGIATDLGPWQMTAVPDRPPEFERVAGVSDTSQAAKPSDTLNLDIKVRDDVGVAAVAMEYRVNDGPVQSVPLAVATPGAKDARIALEFPLAGKVNDGDAVRYRLKATDNRNLPSENLGPNVAYHPAEERWSELRVSNDADALAKQEARDQKELVERRLNDLIQKTASAARLADRLRNEADGKSPNAEDLANGLRRLDNDAKGATDATNDLAKLATQIGLEPLAAGLKDIATDNLRRAAEDLQAAKAADASRPAALRRTEQALNEAREKLEALRELNREMEKARQDEARLRELSDRQKQLADEAANASTPEERERIAREQERIAAELKKLTEQSDALKEALKKAREEEARRLADKAADLAKKQRELDEKIKQQERDQVAKKLADAAAKQKKLAEEADRLSKKAKKPNAPTPQAGESAEKAAEYLRRGEPEPATQQQAKAADQLDRLADDLKKAADAEAARRAKSADDVNRLRKQQDDLAKRAGAQKTPADLARAARELAELQKRFNQIDAAGQEARKEEARQALARAQDDLRKGRAADVGASQEDARRALERLEDALRGATPADEKAQELARLQKDLADELAKTDDPAKRRAAADREEQIVRELQKLKASEAPVRQADAIDAAIKALRLLRDKPEDGATDDALRDAADKVKKLADQLAQKESDRDRAARLAEEQAKAEADDKSDAEKRRRANQIADEAKQIKGGDKASAEKQALLDALAKQQKTPPQSPLAPQTRHDVTEAMKKLADGLAKGDDQAKADPPGKRNVAPDKPLPEPKVDRKPPPPAQPGLPSKEDVQKAKDLAKEQRDLIELVRKATGAPTDPVPGETGAANKQEQEDLTNGTADLKKELQQQSGSQPNTPSGQQADDAAKSADEAEGAMRDATKPGADGKQKERSRKKAADALDRASKQVGRNAPPDAEPKGGNQDSAPAGKELRDAQGKMQESRDDLREGKTDDAKSAMQKAAEALAKAARMIGRRDTPPQPNPNHQQLSPPKGELAKELQQHAGKAWGDLPGELKTRLLQDMKAQYGDDYARVIKLYFEQIAEAK